MAGGNSRIIRYVLLAFFVSFVSAYTRMMRTDKMLVCNDAILHLIIFDTTDFLA